MGRRKCCCDATSKCETACIDWQYTSFELSGFSSSHKWGPNRGAPINLDGNATSGTSNGIPYGGMPKTSTFDLSSINGTYLVESGDISISDWKIYTGESSASDATATSKIPCYGVYKSEEAITPNEFSVCFPEYVRPYLSFGGIGASNSALGFVGSNSVVPAPSGVNESALGSPVYLSYDVTVIIFRGFLTGDCFAFYLGSSDINSVSEFAFVTIAGSATVPDSAFCIGGATFGGIGNQFFCHSLQNKFNCCPSTPSNIYKHYVFYDAATIAFYPMMQRWSMSLTRNSTIAKQNKPASGIYGYNCSPMNRVTSSSGQRVTSSNDPRIVG